VRRLRRLLVTAIAAASVGALLTEPAIADPPAVPPSTAVAGVGDDTTDGVMNALAHAYDPTDKQWVDWNAFPPNGSWDLTTKAGSPAIGRPDGEATNVLLTNQTFVDTAGKTRDVVEYTRSSYGRSGESPANVSFVAFARDAATWAASAITNAPATLTPSP